MLIIAYINGCCNITNNNIQVDNTTVADRSLSHLNTDDERAGKDTNYLAFHDD